MLKDLFFKEKKPFIGNNTFLLWEPCSKSHAEIIPGYAKYLLDLGYEVSVMISCDKYHKGLFSRINNDKISINKFNQKEACRYFEKYGLNGAKGCLITTARRLSMYKGTYEEELSLFPEDERAKVFFVDHDIHTATDEGNNKREIITLMKVNYENALSTVINPHYFGHINFSSKNNITNFIMIGALKAQQRNTDLLVNSVKKIVDSGITNFKITVIGNGSLKGVEKKYKSYFDLKGRVDFETMYRELEKADFFLPMLDNQNPKHDRYITTGTSGSFQLIYGFRKPCLIVEKFAGYHGFNNSNSIVYKSNSHFTDAMITAINMNKEQYADMQWNLTNLAESLYHLSLDNMRSLVS